MSDESRLLFTFTCMYLLSRQYPARHSYLVFPSSHPPRRSPFLGIRWHSHAEFRPLRCNSHPLLRTIPMTALLLPGQPLPAEFKQLQPGHGCYTSKDGILRASAIGYSSEQRMGILIEARWPCYLNHPDNAAQEFTTETLRATIEGADPKLSRPERPQIYLSSLLCQ
jgi:hypothetical protein